MRRYISAKNDSGNRNKQILYLFISVTTIVLGDQHYYENTVFALKCIAR